MASLPQAKALPPNRWKAPGQHGHRGVHPIIDPALDLEDREEGARHGRLDAPDTPLWCSPDASADPLLLAGSIRPNDVACPDITLIGHKSLLVAC